jgi:hypothetical protein
MRASGRSLITHIAPAAALAAGLAFVMVACSRTAAPAAGSSARRDVASPSAASASASSATVARAAAPGGASSGSASSGALPGEAGAATDVPVLPAAPLDNPARAQLVSAAARSLGSDPALLLARMSRIRYEIYPGVFRGAAGALADGAGNDYDRAALLHDLLAAANPGLKVRYAFCSLSGPQSAAEVAAARAAYVAPGVAPTADALAAKASDAKARQYFTRVAAFWRKAAAQEHRQLDALTADVRKAGGQLAGSTDAHLLAIAADHVWIQAQIQGAWVDLDPAVPEAKPGSSLCAPATTSDSLPDAAFDTVTAVVRLETREANQEHETTTASGAWRTADLSDLPLVFAFAEPSGLHAPAPQPAGMLAYTPLLIAGPHTAAAAPIVIPEPNHGPSASQGAAAAVAGAAAAFGGTPPPPPPAPAQPAGPVPVALRLDVAVAGPHIARVSVDRPIFDRISATDRAAGRAATAHLADFPLYTLGTAWDIAVNLGTGVAGAGDWSRIDVTSKDPAMVVRAFGLMQRGYYTLRRAVFADTLGPAAPPVFAAQPGVSFLGLAPQAAGVDPFGLAIDRVVEGARPVGADGPQRLAWAVASVYGKRLAIGAPRMLASADALDTLPFDDAIEMFYIARHASNAPTIVRSASDIARLQISDDAKVRLEASIAGGASAVVPAAAVGYGGANDSGWWILEPDGRVTDEMQSGMRHSSLPPLGWSAPDVPIGVADQGLISEAFLDTVNAVRNAIMFGKNGSLAFCAAAVVSVAMASGDPGAIQNASRLATAVVKTIQEAKTIEEAEDAAVACGGV